MKLHLVALPHTRVSKEFFHCAYSQKLVNFCTMMKNVYDLQLYAPEGVAPEGVTLIPCLSDSRRKEIFGDDNQSRLYNWPTDEQTKEFNENVIVELKKIWKPGELILLSGGWTHRAIQAAFPQATHCEPMVGYYGVMQNTFHAYESYAHLHWCQARNKMDDVRYYDTVIHPYCDKADFPVVNQGDGKYLFFVGRLIKNKGLYAAVDISKQTGLPLWVAGAGAAQLSPGVIVATDGTKIQGNVKYCGVVEQKERNELMAGAVATLCPTIFAEPGCNVMFESLMSGTPVISTDFGIFTEVIKNGFNGCRFHLLRDAVAGVQTCSRLDPIAIANWTRENYSLEATAPKFKKWFDDLETLSNGKGWYSN
jgi:glycosyltransferase involved in cell wall biosynthesis